MEQHEVIKNPLIVELELLRVNFDKTTEKLIKDIQRHEKIMTKADKRQKQEYDELQRKFAEVEAL